LTRGTQPYQRCCARKCARTWSDTVHQHPAATKLVHKNRPEIRKFRPVLRARVALANGRLQPLGHLTADSKCTWNQHFRDPVFLSLPTTVFQTVAFVKFDRKIACFTMSDPQSFGHTREEALTIRGALVARVMRRFSFEECRNAVGRPQVEVIPSRVAAFTGHSATSLDTTNRYAEISRFAWHQSATTRRIQGSERNALDTKRPTVVARLGTPPFPGCGPWPRIARLRAG
jgi:hypothetical protein